MRMLLLYATEIDQRLQEKNATEIDQRLQEKDDFLVFGTCTDNARKHRICMFQKLKIPISPLI